jgi:hypothetical protein
MQLVLNITDKAKANLLLEFLKSLNYVNSVKEVEEEQDFDVPEWHKKIVLDRIKNAKPENYIAWKDFKKELKKKYDF